MLAHRAKNLNEKSRAYVHEELLAFAANWKNIEDFILYRSPVPVLHKEFFMYNAADRPELQAMSVEEEEPFQAWRASYCIAPTDCVKTWSTSWKLEDVGDGRFNRFVPVLGVSHQTYYVKLSVIYHKVPIDFTRAYRDFSIGKLLSIFPYEVVEHLCSTYLNYYR